MICIGVQFMSWLYHILLLISLILCVDSIFVRITDRKPKWAVNRDRHSVPPQKPNSYYSQHAQGPPSSGTTQSQPRDAEKDVQIDIHKIPKSRDPFPFSGSNLLMG